MLAKMVFALVLIPMGFAQAQQVKAIQCADLNTAAKAPVFFDLHDKSIELGNLVSINGQFGKSTTVYGALTSLTEDYGQIYVEGSFGTTLKVDTQTGSGQLSGMIKWDPATGAATAERLKDYPVKCHLDYL